MVGRCTRNIPRNYIVGVFVAVTRDVDAQGLDDNDKRQWLNLCVSLVHFKVTQAGLLQLQPLQKPQMSS